MARDPLQVPDAEKQLIDENIRKEETEINAERASRDLAYRYHRQIIRLRWWVVNFASVVVILLCGLLIYALLCGPLANPSNYSPAFTSVLIVAPIAAIATIVVFVLIGVFRGFRDRDMDNIPAQTALRTAGNPGD